jgi:hypothetical protein
MISLALASEKVLKILSADSNSWLATSNKQQLVSNKQQTETAKMHQGHPPSHLLLTHKLNSLSLF